jgi:hypothetical protein
MLKKATKKRQDLIVIHVNAEIAVSDFPEKVGRQLTGTVRSR